MPNPIKAWAAQDGSLYASAEEAGRHDLFMILTNAGSLSSEDASNLIDALMQHSETVVAALTTGPRSKPRARKTAGTTNPRRAAKRATAAQAESGFKLMREAANHISEEVPAGAD